MAEYILYFWKEENVYPALITLQLVLLIVCHLVSILHLVDEGSSSQSKRAQVRNKNCAKLWSQELRDRAMILAVSAMNCTRWWAIHPLLCSLSNGYQRTC